MTSQNQTRRLYVKITDGPSRETLFDGLRLRHEGRRVTFTLGPDLSVKLVDLSGLGQIQFAINAIGIEDGSGKSWRLSLQTTKKLKVLGSNKLVACYNTRTREGRLFPDCDF